MGPLVFDQTCKTNDLSSTRIYLLVYPSLKVICICIPKTVMQIEFQDLMI